MADHVITDLTGGVLTLTLNRPEKKNALTVAMYAALVTELDRAADNAAVGCVLLQGNGDTFTAGNDLAEFAAISAGNTDTAGATPFLNALAHTSVPIVAAVHGRAVGIGTTMLLHCDLVLVSDDAQLSTPFVNLALVPEAASSLLLPARIGHVRAFAMFVLGEPVDAPTAVAWGLANAVVPRDELRAHAQAVAGRVAQRAPASVRHTKRLMRDAEALSAHMAEETRVFAAQLKSEEAREAFAAFRDKRVPDFTRFRS